MTILGGFSLSTATASPIAAVYTPDRAVLDTGGPVEPDYFCGANGTRNP